MSVELWVPRSARPGHVCRVPTKNGECGEQFYTPEELARHVARCVRQHEQEIQEESPRSKIPGIFDPEKGDPEYEHFLRHDVPARGWLNPDGTWREQPHRARERNVSGR